jgi:hypothetical protein
MRPSPAERAWQVQTAGVIVFMVGLGVSCTSPLSNPTPHASLISPGATVDATPAIRTYSPTLTTTRKPSGGPTDTQPPVETPDPTASATATPASSAAVPADIVAGKRASDDFWRPLEFGCFFGFFDIPRSLREVYDEADIVLTGRMVDLRARSLMGGDTVAIYAVISPTEVIRGGPALRNGTTETLPVLIGWKTMSVFEQLRSRIPDHDHLWFIYGGTAGHYGTVNDSRVAVLREINGTVRVIEPRSITERYGSDHYPVTLEGTSFEELLDRVREIAINDERGAGRADSERPELAGSQSHLAC